MSYTRIEVQPAAGALGADIHGVDVASGLDNETFDEIYRAFLEHSVIFIRDQKLTPDEYLAFGRRFGEPVSYPFSTGLPDNPNIFEIVKEPNEKKNFGGGWHSDMTYTERPPLATMLHALETPPYGGDTMYAGMYKAYENLSDGLKSMLDGLKAVNSAGLKKSGGRASKHKDYKNMTLGNLDKAEQMEALHPVVRTHPGTGRKALYVNQAHTIRFDGWTEEESKPLIDYLAAFATRPEHTCRMPWRPGTVGIWDNRCTQHFAVNDYHGHRRRMHRITVGTEAVQ